MPRNLSWNLHCPHLAQRAKTLLAVAVAITDGSGGALPSLAWPYRLRLETCLGLCCALCGARCGREPAVVSSSQRCCTSSWRVCPATSMVTKACCPVCQAGNCVIERGCCSCSAGAAVVILAVHIECLRPLKQ